MIFQDRTDAGRKLAQELMRFKNGNVIVCALPRGGVVTGYEVARALQAPLEVLVVRKIGAPWNPELGIGAIAPDGKAFFDMRTIASYEISKAQISDIIEKEKDEIERREQLYRKGRPFPNLNGKTVILVDDGLATGYTAKVGLISLRSRNPAKLILAVPVCAPDSAHMLAHEADEVVCLYSPRDFGAVGRFYQDFSQTADMEVIELLQDAAAPTRFERERKIS